MSIKTTKVKNEYNARMKKERKDSKCLVECICPKCKKIHHLILHWIGKIPARKFCTECSGKNETVNDKMVRGGAEYVSSSSIPVLGSN